MKEIDIIMPTMWAGDNIVSNLKHYCQSPHINKIIIIDNKRKSRPKSEVFDNPKIEIVDYGRNIYVNPAWNEGYYRSSAALLCLLNDDINVDNEVFEFIAEQKSLSFDIIGVNLRSGKDNETIGLVPNASTTITRLNYNRSQPIGGQAWAFGICLFIKRESYKVIPSLYQIWFGDDYLVQRCQDIYVISTNKITGVISKTIATSKPNGDIAKRIELDTKNAYKFNDFQNGKQWDILKNNRFTR